MIKNVKLGVIAVAILLITGFAQKAEAFPLPCTDFTKIKNNVSIVMNQIQEIKAEIESNLHIIKEIQNGGYGAAVNDLFGKIVNGDYDRFGNRLKTIKSSTQASFNAVRDGVAQSRAEKEARKQGMSEAEAREYAQKQTAEKQAKREENRILREKTKAEAKANRQKTGIENAYNWLKNNRSVTDSVRSAASSAQNGNYGGVTGAVFSGTSSVMQTKGSNENTANFVGALGQTTSNIVNSVQEGGDVINIGRRIAEDGDIKSSAENTFNAYQNLRKSGVSENATPSDQPAGK